MKLAGFRLRQRDGISCGPTVAVVAGALLDDDYRARLNTEDGPVWFAAEQAAVHRGANKLWPRRLGMTPRGLAAAVNAHSDLGYRWRLHRGLWRRGDSLDDVIEWVRSGLPVAMLIGGFIPRHWVLFVGVEGSGEGTSLCCYEPSSGAVRAVPMATVRRGGLTGLGYRRPFAFVLPGTGDRPTRCAP